MPLIQVIPFKREEIPNYKVSTRDREDQVYYNKSRAAERTKFHGWYRWLTKTNKKKMERRGNNMKKCPIPDVGKIWSQPLKTTRRTAPKVIFYSC